MYGQAGAMTKTIVDDGRAMMREVASNIQGAGANSMIKRELEKNASWYKVATWDDNAWAKSKHVVAEAWRKKYCVDVSKKCKK